MEIPEISIITDFGAAGMDCLQNPSLISGVFSLSNLTTQVYSFWKWGAVIIAIFATFSSIIKRIKVIHIRRIKSSSESLLQHLDIDLDLSDDDDSTNDSSRASSDSEDDDHSPTSTASFLNPFSGDRDFRLKGSTNYYKSQGQNGHLRLRRHRQNERSGGCEGLAWPDFGAGNGVVKLWDSLGLSLGFDSFDDYSDSDSVVSLWDFDKEKKISDAFGGLGDSPEAFVAAVPSRPVVLSAKAGDNSNGVVLGAYDTRMGGQKPALYAEWGRSSSPAKVVGLKSGGVDKVYVRDDVSGALTVGDVRRVKTPLETVTETDGDLWWDADAVILEDEFADCSK
ncbi:uncharacterized protein LOC113753088 [Coffea eugenioides]|uniref:uncharacterized protein LOC113753088 n=1 Tax=Coffea eugenioides TaxID=49369 RepID=UPI000F612CD9|nr:uncharacterized protein LOC113753088 [Coffea eugenioides]